MNWTDECLDHLIGGDCLNIVGLDGSGRSNGLRIIAEALAQDPSDWTCQIWSPNDIASMDRRGIISKIDALYQTDKIPVLLIDDFGDILMSADGLWLERILFSRVFEATEDYQSSMRCVVVTHPRDREIIGPGSGLRERARHIYPLPITPTKQEMADFGCANAEELLLLTGNNNHLLNVGGSTPNTRRGNAHSTARKRLHRWVGQLDIGHQNRLDTILNRSQPPLWHSDDADPLLTPIVVPKRTESLDRCAVMECLEVEEVSQLLVGMPWPDHDLHTAAGRFCARCGNDPSPLWVDNYLSDTWQLDFDMLLKFLDIVLSNLPRVNSIRLLSRNWVGGQRVRASEILDALKKAEITPELERRIQWRLYDQRSDVNLHRRELILNSRRSSFSLPPVRIIIGQDAASNETDAAVAFISSKSAYEAWKNGTVVLN